MRAALYTRVSTDEQSKGYSLTTQLEACREYCEEHGFEIVGEFADDYTGASLDRPELDKLRDMIANDTVGAVVVYDLDRLARKAAYQMLLEEEFKKVRARVYYVRGDYADTDEGRLLKQVRASIAEYERAKILERSRRGLKGKARAGYVIVGARPPYGYRVQSEPHKSWLVVDEEEARVVRLIFEWYIYGDESGRPLSLRAIARKLTSLRIPTRGDKDGRIKKKHGRGIWHHGVVNRILKNETYVGVWHYNKNDCSEKQRQRPKDEWIAVEVPAIVERDLWEKAQARLPHNSAFSSRNTKWRYLLRRRLTCLNCGRAVSCFTKAKPDRAPISYYRCDAATGRMPGYECPMPSFRGDQLEPAVWGWVSDLFIGTSRPTGRRVASTTSRIRAGKPISAGQASSGGKEHSRPRPSDRKIARPLLEQRRFSKGVPGREESPVDQVQARSRERKGEPCQALGAGSNTRCTHRGD
jgi:site-specific DNA recombinase